MRDEVFSKLSDGRLRIYAVWQPILAADTEDKVPDAARLLSGETRASFYWDPRSEAGNRFKQLLKLPIPTPAWDIYFLYAPGSRWEAPVTDAASGGASAPPLPLFWMHQLSLLGALESRYKEITLDGARFREEVEKVLKIENRESRIGGRKTNSGLFDPRFSTLSFRCCELLNVHDNR